jgi:hypothetical protein
MEAYKCTKCGVVSPIVDGNKKPIPQDKPCFHCGCKEKEKITLPNFVQSKKGRRRRFGGGGTIMRIGL